MSTQSKKSSWFARLGSALGRKPRSASLGQKRRGLRFESLETRALLSATVPTTISGYVYESPTTACATANDTGLANITVNLWRDGGDGVFEGNAPGSDDTLWGSATSKSNGQYAFNNVNLPAGVYYVQQALVPGTSISASHDVKTLVIGNYLKGMTIDSFAATSQFVSGSLHSGSTGSSSQSTTDAIGGNRSLYVQLTSAGGGVSLGANSDWPGLLDFGANAGSNGVFQVDWDGANSNPAQLNPTGLDTDGSGIDITSQGASTGLELNTAADHSGGTLVIKVYTDANDWSSATVVIPNTGDGSLNSNDTQFIAFSSFQPGAGSGANFTQVGAIQMSIKGVKAIDGEIGPIQAVGPQVFSDNFVNVAEADLSITKSAASTVVAGQDLTYTLTTTNNGPYAATGATVVDPLPAGTSYVSAGGQGSASVSAQTVTLNVGNLAVGASATSTIVVGVNSSVEGTTITNTATVSGNQLDPNLANNTASAPTTVNAPVQPASIPDLKITKTAAATVTVGSDLTYTMVVSNNSLTTATNVTITDPLPAGFIFLSASGEISESRSGSTLTLNLGSMAAQAQETITVVGQVTAAAGNLLTNTARVDDTQGTFAPDNTSTATTTIVTPIATSASKYYYVVHIA